MTLESEDVHMGLLAQRLAGNLPRGARIAGMRSLRSKKGRISDKILRCEGVGTVVIRILELHMRG